MAELTNPQNTPTGDGATLTIESDSDLGMLWSYSKTTPFTGTDEENAAEIMANGVGKGASTTPNGTDPETYTNTRVVDGQDPLTDYYAGWVQDAVGVFEYLYEFYTDTAGFTFARAGSDQASQDFDDLTKVSMNSQPAFVGTRRVDNITVGADDLSDWIKFESGGATATLRDDGSARIDSVPGGRAFIYKSYAVEVGEYQVSMSVTDVTQGLVDYKNILTIIPLSGTVSTQTANRCVTNDDIRVFSDLTVTVGGGIDIRAGSGCNGTSETSHDLSGILLERVEGQTNNYPSKFAVDIEHHLTENMNTTEGVGIVIEQPDKPLYKEYIGTVYGDSLTNNVQDFGNVVIGMPYTLTRLAVAGDSLAAIRAVFEANFPTPGDNFVMLEGGVNTLNKADTSPVASMQADMTAMVTAAEAVEGMKIVCMSVTPWKGNENWTTDRQTWTDEYNTWMQATWPHYYADLYAELEDPANPDTLLPAYNGVGDDWLHPSNIGYTAGDVANTRLFPKVPASGILVEDASTRRNAAPSDFSDPAWVKTAGLGVGATVRGPMGDMNATVLAFAATGDGISQTCASSGSCASIWLRGTGQITLECGATQTRVALNVAWTRHSAAEADASIIKLYRFGGDDATELEAWHGQLETLPYMSSEIYGTDADDTRSAVDLTSSFASLGMPATVVNNFSLQLVFRLGDDLVNTIQKQVISMYGSSQIVQYRIQTSIDNRFQIAKQTEAGTATYPLLSAGTTPISAGDRVDLRIKQEPTGITSWVNGLKFHQSAPVVDDDLTEPLDSIYVMRRNSGDGRQGGIFEKFRFVAEALSDGDIEDWR